LSTSGQLKHGRSVREQAQDEFSSQDILAMFNFVSDAMAWIKDREFRYRWANRTLLLNFSFSDESQILGRTDHDFNPPYLADLYQADDSRVLSGKTLVARVEPVGTCEALSRGNETWKLPLHNTWGEIIGTFGLSRPLPGDLFLAAGAGKQRLYVIPSLKLVVVRQGDLRKGMQFRDAEFLSRLLLSKSED